MTFVLITLIISYIKPNHQSCFGFFFFISLYLKNKIKKIKIMKKKQLNTEKTPLKVKIVGMLIFPIALLFWCVDRLIHVIMPHATHNKFTEYLNEPQNMKWTIARIITLFVPFMIWKIIVWLIW